METNPVKPNTEIVYRGIICRQVEENGWKIVIGQAEYLFPSLFDAKRTINGLHEDCVTKYCGFRLKSDSVVSQKTEKKQKKKKRHPILIALIVLFALIILGTSTSSTETPAATATPTKKAVVTSTPTKTPFISATPKRTKKATVKPTATVTATPTAAPTATPTEAPTATPIPTPTEEPTATPFTVEHDAEYYATQDYIHKFLTEKGYEVRTFIGVPDIGRYEDDTPDDLTVPWYAFVKHKGEWTQFTVLLFNGEVSFIRPAK